MKRPRLSPGSGRLRVRPVMLGAPPVSAVVGRRAVRFGVLGNVEEQRYELAAIWLIWPNGGGQRDRWGGGSRLDAGLYTCFSPELHSRGTRPR